ncbi:class I SAM-dependent methyltransferase [Cyclobacterium sp. 1_MG-2023]|uniref:class I SAM-dependent methyltransferase n=1 Tax=Cyclobacterium sp. 1_MG-2023 TaxID=3062681 RepID=UPI0026E19CF0|nr:class I SAM-dependent methyltransferase [Cyclobacterium sp. 1_MG-2023]MDO6436686.1 class I SAM-dependent methyltransferase [Cyclobacterium sp. 1_MG-2023]
MTEFWEENFKDKQSMWGFSPADAAIETVKLFQKHELRKILVPGFGYGRNAKVFMDEGFDVTGIEISETAIDIARKQYGNQINVHHGSVSGMPFDNETYDGIFCYALIHLLEKKDRPKLIADCYKQLNEGGLMVFVAISTEDHAFGKGEEIGKNRFLTPHGVELFFYNLDSVNDEFGDYGLLESKTIMEPAKNIVGKPGQKFWQIVCKKAAVG